MSTQTMKQSLRQSIIAARQKMDSAERAEYGRAITARLVDLKAYQRAQVVLGYMSFGAEFATMAWVQCALQDGKQVLLPKVNKSSRQLELYRVRDLKQDVAPGLWDIPEPLPQRCDRVDALGLVDFILLPGVAFARDGSRLGYGGGFYDKLLERICPDVHTGHPLLPLESERLLAGHPGWDVKADDRMRQAGHPVLVAAAFALQLINDIPQESTDRKVEWLLTEHEVIDCAAERKKPVG
jgi:5-formyltetrahydrofolate cyclo-ligase